MPLTKVQTGLLEATGTPNATTFLRGDGAWAVPGSGGTLAVSSGGTGQTSYTDGQLLIGNSTGNTLTKATLTQGTGITITNGAGSITIAASGGGGGGFSNMQVFTSNGTFTVPAGITKVKVTVVGGGGGGGGVFLCPPAYAGGGGGGGAAIEIISGLTPGGTVSVTVGGGGAGGAGADGSAGGTSSFGAFCSATGGSGGGGYTSSGSFAASTGGIGSGGDLNIRGGGGAGANPYSNVAGNSLLGGTTSSPYANGTRAGAPYGGGGAGGVVISCAFISNGGAGAAGVVIVEW
jgi:hypothetical protein